jgi:hypothetical protein
MRKCEKCHKNNAVWQITHEFETINVCTECKNGLVGEPTTKQRIDNAMNKYGMKFKENGNG